MDLLLLHSLVLVIQLSHTVIEHFLGLKVLILKSCECILHHFELALLLLALLIACFKFILQGAHSVELSKHLLLQLCALPLMEFDVVC